MLLHCLFQKEAMFTRCTFPYFIKSSTIFDHIDGNGKRISCIEPVLEAIAAFTPISSPLVFTKAPPLFPLLTGIGLQKDSTDVFCPKMFKLRVLALIDSCRNGRVEGCKLPTANTHSPYALHCTLP